MPHFDAMIIGMGQAGPSLAARLSGAGMRVAIVERSKFGGTCVNDGCTPTKTLIASAYVAHLASRSAEFGVMLDGKARIDMRRVKARKDEVVARSRSGLETWLGGLPGIAIYRGQASFVGPTQVRVGTETITAERIYLNVGGRPSVPDLPGLDTVPYLTNVSMMGVESVPRRLIVVGGSYVGLEFAQMFRRFGAEVTVIEMADRLVVREDPDVSLAIQDFLGAEGVTLRLAAKCVTVQREEDGLSVGVECDSGAPREAGSHLLLATGRTPNTDDLGLAAAGIETNARGYVEVDESLCTSNPNVWALGDCNGKGAFTHTAYNDYEIVADNLLANAGRKHTDRVAAYALYTDPPLGRVGMSESDIGRNGLKALVGKRPMSRVARAVERGETNGFLKIHVEEGSQRILGAALLGVGCDESVHSILDAVYAATPYPEFQRRVRIHPTVSELLPSVLETLTPLR
jgi:pyruvate/2-oxoglutarate dehydrogenase complex dihydrolipoamide dehydrogenase (E3) component